MERNYIHKNPSCPPSPFTSLRIMQWNMLAHSLCTASSFPIVPTSELHWTLRLNLLLSEIKTYQPDILCMEEVEPMSPDGCSGTEPKCPLCLEVLETKLKGFGLDLAACSFRKVIGCAIFVNREKVQECLLEKVIPLSSHHDPQIALICSVKSGSAEFRLVVTHLKAVKKFQEVRESEMKVIVSCLNEMDGAMTWEANAEPKQPLTFLIGDLNADPDEPCIDILRHTGFKSVYEEVETSNPLLPKLYTTWKLRYADETNTALHESKRVIDYIWYRDGGGKRVEVLGCVWSPAEKIVPEYRFPCYLYGSDHLAIVADVVIGDR